jgi:1-acyl-sn-glycerol-3-phosphate acyltransferase
MQAEAEQPEPDPTSIADAVAGLVAELAPRRGRRVEPGAVLADLGYDSLACADLAVALEDRFGVRLADGDVTALRTVGDVTSSVGVSAEGRPRIPPGMGRLQRPVAGIAGWAFKWQARLKVEGREHVPAEGPVIVAANHRSFLDIPLLVVASPRPISFMGKRELFKNPLARWFLHETGGFPVRREISDLRAVDVALACLARGDVLGLYPEGTRNRGEGLLPFLNGAAWLAMHTGAPIVPCGITGTEKAPEGRRTPIRRRVRVAFGPPISPGLEPDPGSRREKAEAITDQLRGAIEQLLG